MQIANSKLRNEADGETSVRRRTAPERLWPHSLVVVILAPRDEAAALLGYFFSQAAGCVAAPTCESLPALRGMARFRLFGRFPNRDTRQTSSRGAVSDGGGTEAPVAVE